MYLAKILRYNRDSSYHFDMITAIFLKKGSDEMLCRDWFSEYLEHYVRPVTKRRSFVRYAEIVEKHIEPRLGEFSLQELSPQMLQKHVSELLRGGNVKTGEGLSVNSVNAIITVLQNALKTAYELGLTEEYVGSKIKRPRAHEKKIECFSVLEQKKIEEYVLQSENSRLFGVVLCLYTGLRIGELLALEWGDVDVAGGILRVNKSCYYGKDKNGVYGRITDTPKTQSSVRMIPLPKQLLPRIAREKKKSLSIYLVANGTKEISVRSYQRSFSLMLDKLSIPHRGFHALRHTFATRALECGMDVKTLSELLGHKSPTVTLNRYAHSLLDHKREMMNRLGRLL